MNQNAKTYRIVLGGICTALSVLFVFLAQLIPGVELTFYAAASVFVAVMIMEGGLAAGALIYLATVLLGLMMVPLKTALLPYIFFFGLYGFIKFFGEKPKRAALQVFIKAAAFLLVFFPVIFLFQSLFFGEGVLPDTAWPVLMIGGLLMFFLYDYFMTILLQWYRRRVGRSEKETRLSGK